MRYFAVLTAVLLIALIIQKPATAQIDQVTNEMDSLEVVNDSLDFAITEYDKYTPIIGGEEVRMRNGLKINGMIKDLYPDSTLKHKGYYTNGQLVSMYKNYYSTGILERSFQLSGTSKLIIQSFYPTGKPKEYIEYRKGEIIKYIEYYPTGIKATVEEHDKKKGYYTIYENYYPTGKLKSSLELIDRKKWSYYQKEYYSSGTIKEEGPVLYNPSYYDYQRQGEWKVYDLEGNLKEKQEYYEGELIL